ncbi:hypothetical protein EKO27_g9905 [Xylaria grammica]|uniref:Uncharacterized protein n=1 Tax=Xylaria grammica TaxID=363999 RepID=A0A439CSN9_9PEZI|nr:hypothetical protein EKO27_g9905 [Xylaria grammica]
MGYFNAFRYSYLASRGASCESVEEEEQHLVNQHDQLEAKGAQLLKPRYKFYPFYLLPAFSWVLACVSTGLLLYSALRGPSELKLLTLQAAPAIEDDIVEYYNTNFENEFAHKTKYRGPPTPEIEAAWDQIWNLGGIEVPLDGPAQLGKPSGSFVHVDWDEPVGTAGCSRFSINCTAWYVTRNLIRQYTWRDYYNEHLREWLDEGENHLFVDLNVSSEASVGDRMHVDHCIETLRLQLMCNADLTPMLVLKDDSITIGTKADFNVHHKCRRWERVVEWQRIHTTDKEASGLRPS